jgi:hypothetical protein
MTNKKVWQSKRIRRWAGLGTLGIVWLTVLLAGAVPAWRQARAKSLEIQELETQLAEMDRWIVAGLWLERTVTANAPQIESDWNTLFPDGRYREELFLELAAVADDSRVDGFRLQEVTDSKMEEDHLWLDRPDGDIGEWMTGQIDGVDLEFYRVKASFQGEFGQVADFLGGLNSIERAMSVHSLEVKPDDQGVRVEMKLDVYVRETTQS